MEETLTDDIEMADAEVMHGDSFFAAEADALAGNASLIDGVSGEGTRKNGGAGVMLNNSTSEERKKWNKSKKKKKKKKKRKISSASSVTDINRFVIDTCRKLKEKKSYLVWNAVGCLGVSAMRDLVNEVNTIQYCGGQLTADGKRFRCGGGVLWNILKNREPKAYKEIMEKGKEFEKQFRQSQSQKKSSGKNANAAAEGTLLDSSESVPKTRPPSVRDRMRVPISYDDLIEEGEIEEGEIDEA